MTDYLLLLGNESITASYKFVNACEVFSAMFEDTGSSDNNEPIPISDRFTKEEVLEYIELFTIIDELKFKPYPQKEEVGLIDFLINNREDYINLYTNNNISPPHCETLSNLFTSYGEAKLTNILYLDTYFNNKRFRQGIMLIIAAFVFNGPENEVDNIISSIMTIMQDNK